MGGRLAFRKGMIYMTYKIAENVWFVGVKNPSLRVFDIIMRAEYGTSYNAYLVKGEKTALIECATIS